MTTTSFEEVYARKGSDDPELEFYSRELATKSLIDFTTYTYPQYRPEPFHTQLAANLESVLYGDIKRLMIFAPPQHGKSELVSVRFPAFFMAKKHNIPIILCSYGATLAWEKKASIEDILYGPDYFTLFPNMFRRSPRGRRSGRKYYIKYPNSRIYAAGVRGAITGRGGGLGIIDDPVKDWRDAYSQTVRDSTWNWWKGTFRSRIWANGRIIIVMTRWHEDDLAGRILNESGQKWTVIRYPAIAESEKERQENEEKYFGSARINHLYEGDPLDRKEGEALAPGRYPIESLLDIQHDIGPRAWTSEYQGVPRPLEGNLVQQQWIHLVDDFPRDEIVIYVRYWDKAATEGGGAKTAGVLMGMTRQKTYYVIDVITGQWSVYQREEIIKRTAQKDKELYGKISTWIEMEPGSGGKESAVATIKNLAGYDIRAEKVRDSKPVRMEPASRQMEAGNIYILNKSWTWEFIDELLMWPHGTFKDQGDAFSGAFRKCTLTGWSRSGG